MSIGWTIEEIILDSDKIRFDNFIKNRTYDYIFKNLPDFISQYFYKSLHTVISNPFHISSDYKFMSGEIYYNQILIKNIFLIELFILLPSI